MVEDKETPNGHVNDSICSMVCKTEANDDDNDDGSSGGTSNSEGIRIYERKKRRKMSNLDKVMKREFDVKVNDANGTSSPDQDKQMLSFDAFTNGPGECSLRHNSNSVLQQMHQQPLNGHNKDGFGGYYQENGCSISLIKKSHDNQTSSSDHQLSRVMSCGLLKHSEGGSSNSELCRGVLSEILKSDKFSELNGLLHKKFGVVNVNKVLDIDTVSLKTTNGVYETSPTLLFKDIGQVWTNLQQVGIEMITLATSLSDRSSSHHEEFLRKTQRCKRCENKVDDKNGLVCDSCEHIYHISCSELVGAEIPPSSSKWYCANCVSNGIGSPHDDCVVCEKLKVVVNSVSKTDELQEDVPNGSGKYSCDVTDENKQTSNICYICKNEVKLGDEYRTCGHSACLHRYYHYKCLTNKQLAVFGPCWYCPSCLCRRCFMDKDDDKVVLCDFCDDAYHIYCATPVLLSVPEGDWYCGKCERELQRIRTQRMLYESIQKKVKVDDGSEKAEHEEAISEREGLDMLVTAAKTLSHPDTFWNPR